MSEAKHAGVSWYGRDYWRATIRIEGKQYTIGYFKNHSDAVRAHKDFHNEWYGKDYEMRILESKNEKLEKDMKSLVLLYMDNCMEIEKLKKIKG